MDLAVWFERDECVELVFRLIQVIGDHRHACGLLSRGCFEGGDAGGADRFGEGTGGVTGLRIQLGELIRVRVGMDLANIKVFEVGDGACLVVERFAREVVARESFVGHLVFWTDEDRVFKQSDLFVSERVAFERERDSQAEVEEVWVAGVLLEESIELGD